MTPFILLNLEHQTGTLSSPVLADPTELLLQRQMVQEREAHHLPADGLLIKESAV